MKRPLTDQEKDTLLQSAKVMKQKNNYFDFNQDTCFRYDYNNYNYYEVVTLETLSKVRIFDGHVCNIIGNMNYTEAYKEDIKRLFLLKS